MRHTIHINFLHKGPIHQYIQLIRIFTWIRLKKNRVSLQQVTSLKPLKRWKQGPKFVFYPNNTLNYSLLWFSNFVSILQHFLLSSIPSRSDMFGLLFSFVHETLFIITKICGLRSTINSKYILLDLCSHKPFIKKTYKWKLYINYCTRFYKEICLNIVQKRHRVSKN